MKTKSSEPVDDLLDALVKMRRKAKKKLTKRMGPAKKGKAKQRKKSKS